MSKLNQMDHFNTIETSTETQKNHHNKFIKKPLVILIPLSLSSLLASYFLYYNPQFSSSASSILDRKYMFLISTGILAILSKNFKLSSHDPNDGGNSKDGSQRVPQLSEVLDEATSQEDEACNDEYGDDGVAVLEETEAEEMEEPRQEQEQEDQWQEEEEDGEDDGYEEDDVEESVGIESAPTANEEISDLRVSTEELNKKFEEFIRKMKEELRIEALQQQQQLIAV